MNIERIRELSRMLRSMANTPGSTNLAIPNQTVLQIHDSLMLIAKDIEKEHHDISHYIITLRDNIFCETFFRNAITISINPFAFGQLIACLDILSGSPNDDHSQGIWRYIHPQIIKSSKGLFIDGHYANAAEDAFIEINGRLKKIYTKLRPDDNNIPDGVELMNKLFSEKAPVMEICNRTTDTGANIHNGTRYMLAGAISALRNPKAHSNDESISEEEALRRLMFASMLMYKIDDAEKHI